jgi:hypothetical protein
MRRAAVIAIAAAAAAVSLTACDKPNPIATVFSGTTSDWQPALCWSHDGAPIDLEACAQAVLGAAGEVPQIPVVPGSTIGISVDPVVAEAGWRPVVNGQDLVPGLITSTYFRFTFPDLQAVPEDGVRMQILAGPADEARGVWSFELVPAN